MLTFDSTPVKTIKGAAVVRLHKDPLEGALVEVYERGKDDPIPGPTDDKRRSKERVAACVTDASGGFEFHVPAGRYELRVSKPDWETTIALVLVDPRRGRHKDLTISLSTGY